MQSPIENVVGPNLDELMSVSTETGNLYEVYPDGRIGYDVEFTVVPGETITRKELFQIAYNVAHEFYYNFADQNPMYLIVSMYPDNEDWSCALSIGIGYLAAPSYMPEERPRNLEAWFRELRLSMYYGSSPDQTDALMAYGNDPKDKPLCKMDNWKR